MQVHFKNFGAKTAVRCGFVEGKYNYSSHIHQFPEIVFCKDGEMTLTVDGKKETMRAGDIAVISPFQVHEFRTEKYVKRWLAVFSPDLLNNFITNETIYGVGERAVFHASDALISYITPKLVDSEEFFFALTEADIRSFKALFCAIYEEYMLSTVISVKRHQKALPAILQYVSAHSSESLSLASIGQALGYSPKYVSLCLSDVEGINLFYLINSFRAERAKELLKNTGLKIIDIAYECGYSNEKSFYRAFLQVTGMTPGQYRKKRRTADIPIPSDEPYDKIEAMKKERSREMRKRNKLKKLKENEKK